MDNQLPDFTSLRAFVEVARAGSFSAAARRAKVPKSTLSHRVSQLEDLLGARLLYRTTRRLSLTEVGQGFLERAEQIVADLDEAVCSLRSLQEQPSGLLRVSAPIQLSISYLGQIVAGFRERSPNVTVDVESTDRIVDLIDEQFDLALRVGPLVESSLIARRLVSLQWHVYASPDYIALHGAPERPEQLRDHAAVVFTSGPRGERWRLRHSRTGRVENIKVRSGVVGNNLSLVRDAAAAGTGLAMLPTYTCADEVELGGLRRVLTGWEGDSADLFAVYPSRRHLSAKVQAFVSYLEEFFASPPWTADEELALA